MAKKRKPKAHAVISPDTRSGLNRARKLIQENVGAKLNPFKKSPRKVGEAAH